MEEGAFRVIFLQLSRLFEFVPRSLENSLAPPGSRPAGRTNVPGLGLPDVLSSKPSTAAAVSQAIQANPDACFRLMRAAAALHILQVDPDTTTTEDPTTSVMFSLSSAGLLLQTGVPGSLKKLRRNVLHARTLPPLCTAP